MTLNTALHSTKTQTIGFYANYSFVSRQVLYLFWLE